MRSSQKYTCDICEKAHFPFCEGDNFNKKFHDDNSCHTPHSETPDYSFCEECKNRVLLKGCKHTAEPDNTLILLTFEIEKWLTFTDEAPNQRTKYPLIYVCCKICFTTLDLWHNDCPIYGEGGG